MTNEEITKLATEYRTIQAEQKALEEKLSAVREQITNHMQAENLNTLRAGVFTIKWTPCSSRRIDTTTLKSEMPEIAEKYTKITESRRFEVI